MSALGKSTSPKLLPSPSVAESAATLTGCCSGALGSGRGGSSSGVGCCASAVAADISMSNSLAESSLEGACPRATGTGRAALERFLKNGRAFQCMGQCIFFRAGETAAGTVTTTASPATDVEGHQNSGKSATKPATPTRAGARPQNNNEVDKKRALVGERTLCANLFGSPGRIGLGP